jgi:uncharacterized membrane protein YidH (DUF202 family)
MDKLPASPPPAPVYGAQLSRPYNPWAIVSISFAASTVIGSWCFGGLVAVITGHVARQQIKRSGEAGANLALVGLIVGYVAIGLTLVFIAVYIAFFVFVFAFAATHSSATPSPTPVP